ncbi:MAG: glycosyltransferase family 2 protein [Sphingomonas sp.]
MSWIVICLTVAFLATQVLYLLSMLVDVYIYTRPVNRVDMSLLPDIPVEEYPKIVLLYPVLDEPEGTMRTTFFALDQIDYPKHLYSVVAVPNHDDASTIASLEKLQKEFPFLEILPVPSTADASWNVVWDEWETNPHVYWYHRGARAGDKDLPPKKTRQLIYAFYTIAKQRGDDFLLNYIDADSAPPKDHFLAAAAGIREYDVLQSRNVAGNLLKTMASTMCAFDHLVWDANKYGHLTANGKHPYWVLGKGLFYKSSDLLELGGFHPWITIEDPEVGMRLWKNGRRLGLIDAPLIEEVPETFGRAITQRKRWVAGFFQSLNVPLKEMGFTRKERFKAWLNFLPCLSMWVNSIGIPVGVWAAIVWWQGTSPLPRWTLVLAALNFLFYTISLINLYIGTWRMTKLVIPSFGKRLWYMLRINPIALFLYWMWWIIPLWLGWRMYRKDGGLTWERTLKINAIEQQVHDRSVREQPGGR